MTRLARHRGTLWLIPLAAMLIIQVSGLHEHLCLDGTEPAVSLHFSDGAARHAEANATHRDVDVSLLGEATLKRFDFHLDMPAAPSALLLILCVVSGTLVGLVPHRFGPVLPLSGAQSHIRPPLRAPPR